MSTGGGWQDQVGGLAPGIKMVTSDAAIVQEIGCSPCSISTETLQELNERFCLIYSGQRRLARKMARQINKTLPTAAETLTAAINRWAQSIKPALATLCENVAAAFSNMAAGLREESEAVEND